jgi:hypothetical protein
MGGTVIFKYLSDNFQDNVKAVVPIIATPVWPHALRWNLNKIKSIEQDPKAEFEFLKTIESMDVINNMKKIPLLMLNGENDDLLPIEKVKNDYSSLKEKYSNKYEINQIVFSGLGHQA